MQPKNYGEIEQDNEFEVQAIGPDPYDFDIEEQAEMLALGKNLLNPQTRAETVEAQFNKYVFS